jgi:uncharacterized protein
VITLDSSALLAILDRSDPDHGPIVEAISKEPGQLIVPCGILAEVGFLIERDLGQRALAVFIRDLDAERYRVDCGLSDFRRVGDLVTRYADLALGYSDATVIACAERHGGRVATLDHRHFGVVAREGTIQIVP